MRLWRLMRPQYAPGLDGIRARRYGGRWNSVGTSMVYCATSVSLAVLETFVHLPVSMRSADKLPQMVLVEIDVPDDVPVEDFTFQSSAPLPDNAQMKQIGNEWARKAKSLCLMVPSMVVPHDRNCLLNPEHEAMDRVRVRSISQFHYDGRMI